MDWVVTAGTLFCDEIGEWVTVIVYPDSTVKCHLAGAAIKKKGKMGASKETLQSIGPDCGPCTEMANKYKEEVFRGEAEATKGGKA